MKLPLVSYCLGGVGGANGFLIPDHSSARVRGQAEGAVLREGTVVPVLWELCSPWGWSRAQHGPAAASRHCLSSAETLVLGWACGTIGPEGDRHG